MTRLLCAALVPLALLLGACGQDTATTAADPAPAAASSAGTTTPAEGTTGTKKDAGKDAKKDDPSGSTAPVPELLDFTGTTVQGEQFDGASLVGRPTVLWFWAPWCPTCRGQIPQVEALAAEHGDEVNVIGIGSLDSAEAIAGFASDVSGVTHLEDVDGTLWRRFGVAEQSSFVVLDAEGVVRLEAGYGGTDDLDAEVESLLG